MRPIDADALIGKLRKWGVPSDAWVIDEIKQAQTIDAVPTIRCKDCRYWEQSGKFPRGQHCTRFIAADYVWHSLAEDFCSLAERRKDDARGIDKSGIEQGDSCPTD